MCISQERVFTTKGAINTKVLRPDCALIAPEKAITSVTNE